MDQIPDPPADGKRRARTQRKKTDPKPPKPPKPPKQDPVVPPLPAAPEMPPEMPPGYFTFAEIVQRGHEQAASPQTPEEKRAVLEKYIPPVKIDDWTRETIVSMVKQMPGLQRRLLVEFLARTTEGLHCWRAQPHQEPFHASRKKIRVFCGGNGSGKTAVGATEFARAATHTDPYNKYPYGLRACIVGRESSHLGDPIYVKLFEPGAIYIIRDEHTGLWRSTRPGDPYDEAYREKWREADPLIPPRLCNPKTDIAWESKKENIFTFFKVPSTGFSCRAYSGEAKPKVGFKSGLSWMDEETVNEGWFPEVMMRTRADPGLIIVTATPEFGSEWLYNLHEAFAAGDPAVDFWTSDTLANVHVGARYYEDFLRVLRRHSPELALVKTKGVFVTGLATVFPEFSMTEYGVVPFYIPEHWNRQLSIDLAANPCVAVFVAIPPPDDREHGKYVYVYDEIALEKCSADDMAVAIKNKGVGVNFQPSPQIPRRQRIERIYVDGRYGLRTESTGKTMVDSYLDAFRRHGVVTEQQGYGVTFGVTASGDGEADLIRAEAIKTWLRGDGEDGRQLRVFNGRALTLEENFRRCSYKRGIGGIVTRKINKKHNDAIDALGYIAYDNPPYVAPKTQAQRYIEAVIEAEMLSGSTGSRGSVSFGPDFDLT